MGETCPSVELFGPIVLLLWALRLGSIHISQTRSSHVIYGELHVNFFIFLD